MSTTWSKFRSLLRRPTHASVSASTPSDPPRSDQALEAILSRVSQLEQHLANRDVPSSTDAQQIASLQSVVAELRAQLDRRDETIAGLEAAHRTADAKLAELESRWRETQQALELAQLTLRQTRQELLDRASAQDRAVSGRLAGLYIVGFVALVAALGTLVLYLLKL